MIRHTASTINDQELDALYNQLGRLAFVFEENVRRHGEATARVDDLLAAITRMQDAARLHRQGLLSAAELYAVIEAASDVPDAATTEAADDGPSVAECAAADRRWPFEKAGE